MRGLLAGLLSLAPGAVAADGLEAVVAARTLYRGQVVTQGAVRSVAVRSRPATGYVAEAKEALGLTVRRTILEGRLLPRAALEPTPDVRSGTTMTVLHRSGTLAVRVPAVALSDGQVGGAIALRVPETGVRIRAIVASPDLAELTQ